MRDLFCKAKRKDNGKWVEGYYAYIRYDKRHVIIIQDDETEYGGLLYRAVLPDTICQYTGLNDANDNQIFEGDIIKFGDKKLVVWWNDAAFQWQANEEQTPVYTYDGISKHGVVWDNIDLGWIAAEIPILGKMTTEIIGNVFDNRDLLQLETSDQITESKNIFTF